jgi:putative ABC transport system permease protein
MISVRWIKAARELWLNKTRTILVVLSIGVGVFTVGTIANAWIVLLDDLNTAYLATNPASAVLTVEPFGDDLVAAVEGTREVAGAEGRRNALVKVGIDGRLYNLNLQAVKNFDEMAISRFTPESGSWPPLTREVLIERSYAAYLGLSEGDPLVVEMPDGADYQLVVAGTVHDLHQRPAGNSEISYGYVSFDTMEYLGEPRLYNALYVTVAGDPLDEDHIRAVVTDVKERVIERAGLTVYSTSIPTPGEAFLTVIIEALLGVLAVVGLFSLLLSGALVVNTVSATITRQIQQIGVMKAMGGRTRQIREIYLASVAVYGALSLVVAVPLAALGSQAFTSYVAQVSNFDILTTGLPPLVLALEVGVGLLVPVAAALIPIGYGTRITVREAIGSRGLGAASAAREAWLDRLIRKMRAFPAPLALAFRNTFRRKGRLVLTLSTLTLAGAIFIAVLSVRESLFASFEEALAYYGYDLSIDLGDSYRVTQLEREASRAAGVEVVEGWLQVGAARIRRGQSESANYPLIGVPVESRFLEPELVAGRWVEPGDRYKLVVNTDFLREEPDVAVGDTIILDINNDESAWEVVGVVTKQYSTPVIYAGYDDLARAINQVGLANRVLIRLPRRDAALQTRVAMAVEDRLKKAGLEVTSTTTRSEFVDTFEMRFDFLTVFLLMLALLLAFVGGMGLAGTMSLNVLERVREIGVMRAIGASDGAVRRIVMAEGVAIGIMSAGLALVVTLPLSKLMSDGVGIAFGGEPLTFHFSLPGVLLWLALVVVIAGLSSYIPARRAAGLTVREVLNYD